MRLYIEKVSPFMIEGYSKNVYLDDQIERMFLRVENQRVKKYDDIEKVKSRVAVLEEIAEMQGSGDEMALEIDDGDNDELKRLGKPRKTKRCSSLKQVGKH